MRPDLLALAVVLAVTALFALWWRAREGRVRNVDERFTRAELDAVGAPPDAWTLLEISAPHCAPCVDARQVLDEVAAQRSDVVVRVADVDEQLELVRTHRVLRAPTVFVLEPLGAVRARVSGVPDVGELAAVLDSTLDTPARL